MTISNFFKELIITFVSGVLLLPNQVNASEWSDTICMLGNSKKAQTCKEIKGDAILNGKQGFLHTFTFPNGKKYFWFYGEQSVLCNWKNTYAREQNKNYWFQVNSSCTDDGFIDISLPSGSTLFKIGQSN